jgi:hypothetical protein
MSTDANPSGESGQPTPGGQGSSGAGPDPGAQSGTGERTFTQADIDRIVADRVSRSESRFADYDQLKKRLADIESAGQTELERATKTATEAEAARAAAVADRNKLLISHRITSAAMRAGATDPEVVSTLLAGDFSVDDQGQLVGDIDRAIEALLESKPYLRATTNGNASTRGSADGGAHGRPPGAGTTPATQMDQILRAR